MTDADLMTALGPCAGDTHRCRVHDSTWHPTSISRGHDVCHVLVHRLDGARIAVALARDGIADAIDQASKRTDAVHWPETKGLARAATIARGWGK